MDAPKIKMQKIDYPLSKKVFCLDSSKNRQKNTCDNLCLDFDFILKFLSIFPSISEIPYFIFFSDNLFLISFCNSVGKNIVKFSVNVFGISYVNFFGNFFDNSNITPIGNSFGNYSSDSFKNIEFILDFLEGPLETYSVLF